MSEITKVISYNDLLSVLRALESAPDSEAKVSAYGVLKAAWDLRNDGPLSIKVVERYVPPQQSVIDKIEEEQTYRN